MIIILTDKDLIGEIHEYNISDLKITDFSISLKAQEQAESVVYIDSSDKIHIMKDRGEQKPAQFLDMKNRIVQRSLSQNGTVPGIDCNVSIEEFKNNTGHCHTIKPKYIQKQESWADIGNRLVEHVCASIEPTAKKTYVRVINCDHIPTGSGVPGGKVFCSICDEDL